MLKGGYCSEEKIRKLWHEKGRLDPIFDSGHSQAYYTYVQYLLMCNPSNPFAQHLNDHHSVRDTLYPLDRKGSSRFWNRAGDKLMQVENFC